MCANAIKASTYLHAAPGVPSAWETKVFIHWRSGFCIEKHLARWDKKTNCRSITLYSPMLFFPSSLSLSFFPTLSGVEWLWRLCEIGEMVAGWLELWLTLGSGSYQVHASLSFWCSSCLNDNGGPAALCATFWAPFSGHCRLHLLYWFTAAIASPKGWIGPLQGRVNFRLCKQSVYLNLAETMETGTVC